MMHAVSLSIYCSTCHPPPIYCQDNGLAMTLGCPAKLAPGIRHHPVNSEVVLLRMLPSISLCLNIHKQLSLVALAPLSAILPATNNCVVPRV